MAGVFLQEGEKLLRKIKYNSPVILTFSFISLGVLGLNALTKGWTNTNIFVLWRTGFLDPMQYVRLFTYVLGHAGYEHFIGNILYILLIGPMIEEKYGSKKLLIMILVTAVVTGIIHLIISPYGLIGASGIVFMLILLSSYANFKKGTIPLTLILVVVAYLGNEITTAIISHDNISQMAHIIGGACGGLFGYMIDKNKA